MADPYELRPPPRRSESEQTAARKARRLGRRFLRYGRRGRARPGRPQVHRLSQRSTVKVSYRRNEGNGKWRAHGRYIAREKGRPDPENRGLGFDAKREDVPVAETLAGWEKAGWKRREGPVKNLDLVQRAYQLSKERPYVKIEWVPGHSGYTWNERADELSTAHLRTGRPS